MHQTGWLERAFGIRPAERRTTLLLFAYSLCLVGAAFIVGRTLGTTLFLSRVKPELIPYTYVLSAVGVSIAATLYARFSDALRRDHMIAWTTSLFALGCVVARLLVVRFHTSLATMAGVYVFFDIVGDICLIQFWTLASELFDARQAKRLFAFIASGGAVAGIVLGGLLGAAVRVLGTENLFYVVAGLLVACGALALMVGRLHGARLSRPKRRGGRPAPTLRADVRKMLGDRYVRSLAMLIAVATLATILVDYQWKVAARAAYLGDEAGLAGYFGLFSLVTSGLALFFQVFLTSRLLARFGVRASLMLLPGALLVAGVGMLLASGARAALWAATAAKGGDGAFRYSIHEATMQVLYRPLPSAFRSRTKAVLDGVAKPLFAAAGGLGIAALMHALGPAALRVATLPMVLAWLALIALTSGRYVTSLGESLERGVGLAVDPLVLDAGAWRVLGEALAGDDPKRAHNALAILAQAPDEPLPESVSALAFHQDHDLACAALGLVAERGTRLDVERLAPVLDHADLRLRALGIAAIIRRGGLPQLLRAARRLEVLLAHPEAEGRVAAAQTLGALAEPRFAEPLLALLEDPVERVRVAAARACARAPAPEAAPLLLAMLSRSRERAAAVAGLLALGGSAPEAVCAHLRALLESPLADTSSRLELEACCRVLARLEAKIARELLVEVACEERTIDAALRAIEARSPRSEERRRIEDALDQALDARLRRAICRDDLGGLEPRLLGDALRRAEQDLETRILGFISALYRSSRDRLQAALGSEDSARRANAVELLDNLLPQRFRSRALLVFGETDAARLAWSARSVLADFQAPSRAEQLSALLRERNPWLVCCALHELGPTIAREDLSSVLEHPSGLVRETAEYSCAHRASEELSA